MTSPTDDSSENDYDDEESENSTEESASQGLKRKSAVETPLYFMGQRRPTGKKQGNDETLKRSKTGSKLDGQAPKMATNAQIARRTPYGNPYQDVLTAYQSGPTRPQRPNPVPPVSFTPVNLGKNVKVCELGTYHKDLMRENGTKQKDKTSQMAKEHQSSQKAVHASTVPATPNIQHLQNATGQPFGANQPHWPNHINFAAHLSQFAANQPHWAPHMPSQFGANQAQWPNHTQYQQFGANQPQWPHMQYQFGANQPQWPNPMPFPTSAQGTQAKGSPVNDGRPPQNNRPKDQKHKLAEDKNASNARNVQVTPTFQLPHDVANHTFPNAPNVSHYGANQPYWSFPAQVPDVTPHSSHSAPFPSGPPGMHVMGNGITINIGSFKNVFQFWDPRTIPEPSKNECKSPK